MPTTEPAVEATDTAADIAMPDLQRALAAQAIAYRVARMFSDQEKALRGGNTAAMIRHHQDSGVDRLTIRVPGIDAPIAKASLAIPKATATVTDPAQLAAFVAGVAPTEVDTVLTIRVHTDMATAAIVADLTTRLEQMDHCLVVGDWARGSRRPSELTSPEARPCCRRSRQRPDSRGWVSFRSRQISHRWDRRLRTPPSTTVRRPAGLRRIRCRAPAIAPHRPGGSSTPTAAGAR